MRSMEAWCKTSAGVHRTKKIVFSSLNSHYFFVFTVEPIYFGFMKEYELVLIKSHIDV